MTDEAPTPASTSPQNIGWPVRLALAAVAGAFLWSALSASPVRAGQLASPTGDVLLIVAGAIENTNKDGEAHFDREMLRALGMTEIVTGTAWHEKGTVFEGVLARRVMEAVGARGTKARAIAANDYKVWLPVADFTDYNILLAMHIDGEALRLRTKGPIWVIYPEGTGLPAHTQLARTYTVRTNDMAARGTPYPVARAS